MSSGEGGLVSSVITVNENPVGRYRRIPRQRRPRIFYHTEIGESFAGRGLASTLIHAALSATRAQDKRVIPVCPFVARYVTRHHDFDDGIDPVTPAFMAALSAVQK